MPASLLFTHSYFLAFDPKQQVAMQPYPPLGTLYAMSVLREAGNHVDLHDSMFQPGPEPLAQVLKLRQPRYLVLYDDGFNWLTKMCLSNMQQAAFSMIELGKQQGCTVLVSSSDASDHREKYLNAGADFILIGEAEFTLRELIASLEDGLAPKDIPGLAYLEKGGLTLSPPRKPLRNLDQLPFPAWDVLDFSPYRDAWLRHHGFVSMNLVTTRGCPFKCNWCAKPIYGQRYNSHSPERIVASIQKIREYWDVDHFWFSDDIFGLKPGWVASFDALLQAEKLKIRYKIQSRADLLLEENAIHHLASSGLETAWIGAESGSQKILDAMEKGTTVNQIHTARQLLAHSGVRVGFFLQFGYLGETKADIQKTLDMVLELMPDEIGISVSYPLPGTGFFEKVKAQLKTKTNWTDSDDLAMLYQGSFSSEYYRALHRYVHLRHRLKKCRQLLIAALKSPFSKTRPPLFKTLRESAGVIRLLQYWWKLRRLENST